MFFAARTLQFGSGNLMLFVQQKTLPQLPRLPRHQRRKGGKSGAEKRYAFEAELKSKRFQEGAYYVRKAIFR